MHRGIQFANRFDESLERPFACTSDKCGMKFTTKSHLNRHMNTHDERVKCANCETTFSRKDALIRHQKKCKGKKTPATSGDSGASKSSNN